MDPLKEEIQKLIDATKEAYADRDITFGEVLGLIPKFIGAITVLAKNIDPAMESGALRVLVIEGATDFYEEFIKPYDIPYLPNVVEDTVVDPALGKAVPILIGATYDTIIGVFESRINPEGGTDEDPMTILALPPKVEADDSPAE
jgi:hypothetical protein